MLVNQSARTIYRWRYVFILLNNVISLSELISLSLSAQSLDVLSVCSALFSGLSTTIYKGIIFSAESIFSWKVEAKASRENTSCNRCRVSFDLSACYFLLFTIANLKLLNLQALRSYRYDEDPLLVACGISIDKQLTQVDGRVLEAPKVRYVLSLDGLCNSK